MVRHAIKDIGYEQDGFHWSKAAVENYIHSQSADIAQGVDAKGNKDEGAGDQGIMFGYACRETEGLMPAPIYFAHDILKSLSEARHSGAEPGLGPDAKSQVTLLYEEGKPVRATSVVVSTQHSADLDQEAVREIVRPHVVNTLPKGWMCPEAEFYVNPDRPLRHRRPGWRCRPHRPQDHRRHLWRCGAPWRRRVLRQGPHQGRPLGRLCRALSGEERGGRRLCRPLHDPARLRHRRLQAAVGLCGNPRHRQGGGGAPGRRLLGELVDLSPRGIREHLGLNKPIYARTSAYGHFGRAADADGGFSWERTDLVDKLKSRLN